MRYIVKSRFGQNQLTQPNLSIRSQFDRSYWFENMGLYECESEKIKPQLTESDCFI